MPNCLMIMVITLQLTLYYLVKVTDCAMQSWTCVGVFFSVPVLTERLKVAAFSWLYCAYMCLHTLHSQTPAVKHVKPVVRKSTVFMNICIRQNAFLAQLCRHRYPSNAANSFRSIPDQLRHLCCGLLDQCIFIEALCNYCYFIRSELSLPEIHRGCQIKKQMVWWCFFFIYIQPGAYMRKRRTTLRHVKTQCFRAEQTIELSGVGGQETSFKSCLRNKYLPMSEQRWEVRKAFLVFNFLYFNNTFYSLSTLVDGPTWIPERCLFPKHSLYPSLTLAPSV